MPDHPRILIIGVGSIGERHLRCFQKTGRCDLVLCEPMAERREDVAARYGVRGYPDWESALEAEPVTAAVIASPAPHHIPTARALVARGLDLLVEKPLSLDREGVAELEDEVRQGGRKVAVGFVYRSLPALRQMREAVRSGRFGRIVQVSVQAGQHFPFYRPAYRDIYYADPAQGGGLIQDMLPHPLNAVEWIVGPATRVVTDAAHAVLQGVTVEDTVHVLSRHGEVMAAFVVNQHQPVNEFSLTVTGDQGAARWEFKGHRWLSAREPGSEWHEEAAFAHERDDLYLLQAEGFLDFLAGRAEPACSLRDGIHTLESTLAVLESRASGRWIDVGRSHE